MDDKLTRFSDFNGEQEGEDRKQNYMFFGNLKNMKKMIEEIMEMDHDSVDKILLEHDWASDHISTANENLDQVYHFLISIEKGE